MCVLCLLLHIQTCHEFVVVLNLHTVVFIHEISKRLDCSFIMFQIQSNLHQDLVYNTIGTDFIADCVSGYIKLHNELVEACPAFSFREDRLQKEKLLPGTGLCHSQSSCSPLMDPVGGDLPGAIEDVLQTVHEQVASGAHHGASAIRRSVEGLNL